MSTLSLSLLALPNELSLTLSSCMFLISSIVAGKSVFCFCELVVPKVFHQVHLQFSDPPLQQDNVPTLLLVEELMRPEEEGQGRQFVRRLACFQFHLQLCAIVCFLCANKSCQLSLLYFICSSCILSFNRIMSQLSQFLKNRFVQSWQCNVSRVGHTVDIAETSAARFVILHKFNFV